jgi:hypothetical protein
MRFSSRISSGCTANTEEPVSRFSSVLIPQIIEERNCEQKEERCIGIWRRSHGLMNRPIHRRAKLNQKNNPEELSNFSNLWLR